MTPKRPLPTKLDAAICILAKRYPQSSTTIRLYESEAAQTKHRWETLVNGCSKISENIAVKNEKEKSKAPGPSSASVGGHLDTLQNIDVKQ